MIIKTTTRDIIKDIDSYDIQICDYFYSTLNIKKDDDFLVFKTNSEFIKQYLRVDEPINSKWFRCKLEFYPILYNNKREIDNKGVHYIYIDSPEPYSMEIGFCSPSGKITLYKDEKLFSNEIEEIQLFRLKRENVVNNIMNSSIDNVMIDELISNELTSVLDESIINDVSNTIVSKYKLNRDAIIALCEIVIFLTNPIASYGLGVFEDRINSGYYNDKSFIELSVMEKLPEIFDNKGVSDKESKYVFMLIQNVKNIYIGRLCNYIFWKHTAKKITTEPTSLTYLNTTNDENTDIDDENKQTVIYTEGDESYKIPIVDVWEQIILYNVPKNPHTGNPLSDEFIQMFEKEHNIERDKPTSKEIKQVDVILTKLMKSLSKLEKNMKNKLGIVLDDDSDVSASSEDEDESYDNKYEDKDEVEEDKDEVEEIEEDKNVEEVEESTNNEYKLNESTNNEYKLNETVQDEKYENVEKEVKEDDNIKGKRCDHCKKEITTSLINTVETKDNKISELSLCSVDCLSAYNI